MTDNMITINDLKLHFPVFGGIFLRKVGAVKALDGVSLAVGHGETVGLVGESGCGKTTLGRTMLRLYNPTSGTIIFDGTDITRLSQTKLRPLRREMQMIFQDAFESLNSRLTVGEILEEPFVIHRQGNAPERRKNVLQSLDRVGLSAKVLNWYPHEFSGGQRQRIGIARAIALNPRLIVCDEPVSALDVSIQSQILNLLLTLQQELKLTYLFISHDLAVVKHISDKIAVMYLGKIVEFAPTDAIVTNPAHPYTQALISAIPEIDPHRRHKKVILKGDVPSPLNPPQGCRFHTRCPAAREVCSRELPELRSVGIKVDHLSACHFTGEVNLLSQ